MRLIDADELEKVTIESMENNQHKDAKLSNNHRLEHLHFLRLIRKQQTIVGFRSDKEVVIPMEMMNKVLSKLVRFALRKEGDTGESKGVFTASKETGSNDK